jgi:hypothetical protein
VASVGRRPDAAHGVFPPPGPKAPRTVAGLGRLTVGFLASDCDIDARTAECIGHLEELLVVDLGADRDDEVPELFRRAYRHLDLSSRPTPAAPAYDAFA